MGKLDIVDFKFKEICKKYKKTISDNALYYHKEIIEEINKLTKICELQNKVASLSNSSVANALMYTLKQIAYASTKPNHEVICEYLERAIEDLMRGMDTAEMLCKYDEIYEVYYQCQ